MNEEIFNQLCRKQAENERLRRAIENFKEKWEVVENSQSDALSHQTKRVQRRQHELNEARQKLFELI